MITHWSYLDAEPQPVGNWNENGVPAIASDGTLYILFFPNGTGARRIQFTAWNAKGELTKSFMLEEPVAGGGWAIDSKGNVYIKYEKSIIGVFDSEGKKVREISVELGENDGFTVLGINRYGELFLTVVTDFDTIDYLKYNTKGELITALRDESKGLGDLDLMGGDSGYYIKCPLEQSEGVVTIFRIKL